MVLTPSRLLLFSIAAVLMADATTALAPRILVLGGTGFIGSAVSRIAIERGFQVVYVI